MESLLHTAVSHQHRVLVEAQSPAEEWEDFVVNKMEISTYA